MPGDVVGVDVADHREVDLQRAVAGALGAQLLQARLQARLPRARRPAVDEQQHGLGGAAGVDQQRVAVEGLQCFEREDHGVVDRVALARSAKPYQIDWIARSASTTPLPWK